MADASACPQCGADMDEDTDDIVTCESNQPVRTLVQHTCPNRCVPPPSPAQLATAADELWLARQRDLAGHQPTGFITSTVLGLPTETIGSSPWPVFAVGGVVLTAVLAWAAGTALGWWM